MKKKDYTKEYLKIKQKSRDYYRLLSYYKDLRMAKNPSEKIIRELYTKI